MKSRTRELKLEIVRMEMDWLKKIIAAYEPLIEAVDECQNLLEEFNHDMSIISKVPKEYEAVDKYYEALDMSFKTRNHRSEAMEKLRRIKEEYEELNKEAEDERRDQAAGCESAGQSE